MFRIILLQIPLCLWFKLNASPNLIESMNANAVTDLPVHAGALTIIIQPIDQSDCKGNKATFSVGSEGGIGAIHYQWKRKRPGDATFATFGARDSMKLPVYNIGTGSEAPDGTLYQVTVSDQNSTVISETAKLTVNAISGIAPVGVATHTVNQGEDLWFKVLTSGNVPAAYQWIKRVGSGNWQDLADNSIVTGSQQSQLNFTKISLPDSGIYKLRVTFPTINGNYCIETSTITRKINVLPVIDTSPPLFLNLPNDTLILCPPTIELADWSESLSDIFPARKTFYRFLTKSTLFNLAVGSFDDNLTPTADLVLHWGIYPADNPSTPIMDEAGTFLDDKIGQISLHPENFTLIQQVTENHCCQIIYWLEDGAGNLTPESLRHKTIIKISERPDIISNF